MRENLHLPAAWDGNLWRSGNPGRTRTRHRHAQLELNLVTRGTGTYLVANQTYRIQRGDLLWLFPHQEHVLVGETADFEMWIEVLNPRVVRRIAVQPGARVLRELNPAGAYCRRVSLRALAR